MPVVQPDQGIQLMQSGLWAALREWCHISCDRPVVVSSLAERALDGFRAADPVGRPRRAAVKRRHD